MTDLFVRPAVADDAPVILHLIRELAIAEDFPFPVTVTESDLRENLFGASPAAEAVLAFCGDQLIGFAVFYQTFATTTGKRGLHLDDLFVRPEFQGKGHGRTLLRQLAAIARDRNCARFEWWALRTNVDALRFYRSVGARAMDELLIFRVQGEPLGALAGDKQT